MISGARQYSQRDFALSLTKARVDLVTNAFKQGPQAAGNVSIFHRLPSQLAHLLFNLIAFNRGRFACFNLSDSFPDHSHSVGSDSSSHSRSAARSSGANFSIASWTSAKLIGKRITPLPPRTSHGRHDASSPVKDFDERF